MLRSILVTLLPIVPASALRTALLTFAPFVSSASAQTAQAWLDVYEPGPPLVTATTTHVAPMPSGGVVAVSTGHQGDFNAPGEAVIRRITEYGDVEWSVTRPLVLQDFIGLFLPEYIAGLDVNSSGEIAVAIGGAGPMEVRLYEPDGTLRWQAAVPVLIGPHHEGPSLRITPGGDVLFAAHEALFAGGEIMRFGLYRLAAHSGQQLWRQGAPSRGPVRLAADSQGDAILAVNRRSTPRKNWRVERYSPAGTLTASVAVDLDANSARIADLAVNDADQLYALAGGVVSSAVLSISPSMSVDWETSLPPTYFGSISCMTDGDVVLTDIGLNWDLVRLNGTTGAAQFSPGNIAGRHVFADAVGLANGNSVVALARTDVPYRVWLQERDPAGSVVREHIASTVNPWGTNELAVGARGNVYGAYWNSDFQSVNQGVLEKVLFHGDQGTSYCGPAVPNSTGQSATVRAVGSTAAAANNLSLLFADLPPGTTVLPIGSRTMGFVAQPGGSQGNLCLGGGVGRFDEPGEIRFASAGGLASVQLELLLMPTPNGLVPAVAGETWNFQAWFRDVAPPIIPTSNFTNAVSVTLR